jgi:hypothetical protein
LFGASLVWTVSAAAFDGISLDVGNGHDDVKIVRLSTWIRQWQSVEKEEKSSREMKIFWELGLAYWEAVEKSAPVGWLVDVSATPVVRFPLVSGVFADIGIGVHIMSEHEIGQRELSTPYHFGSIAGLGVEFGRDYDLSLRAQHLSNASVDPPNPGIDFVLLRLGFHF